MQNQAARYGLPRVSRIVFPATARTQLDRTDLLLSFLALVAPGVEVVTADELLRTKERSLRTWPPRRP